MALTTVDAGLLSSQSQQTWRNRIINGAMVIDQRNAGASVTPVTNQYLVDRWCVQVSQASKITAQQNAGSVTTPAGFNNYLGITSSSAYTVLTGDYFAVQQRIEGYNMADLGWGTANAKTITLSAWVYSSLTGTFGGSIINGASTYSYPFTYSIPVANTWTQISVTIVGPTSGAWLTTNGVGAYVLFSLGVGATLSGTAGSWSANNYLGATGATSVVGTSGATFYITGVQLEKGSTATSFDYRPYGTELALCQRYFYKASSTGGNVPFGFGYYPSTIELAIGVPFPIVMRSVPTFTSSAANTFLAQDSANRTPTTISMQCASPSYASVVFAISGVTAGGGAKLLDNGGATNLSFASEL